MSSDSTLRVIFAGGGTAGHLFPGLAVARRLVEGLPWTEVLFVGSGREQERRWVLDEGFPYLPIACRPAPRRPGELLPSLWNNLRGYLAARRLLRTNKPHVVVGLGGYASVPTARAAIDRGVPLVLLEQNVAPGRATRWLAARAAAVCVAMTETVQALPHPQRVIVTGNPLRDAFAQQSSAAEEDSQGPARQLVVLGGSAGARALNQSVPRALARLGDLLRGWRIVHQSGQSDLEATRVLYARLGVSAEVSPFVREMPQLLRTTSLAVCRSGGTTLAELAASGVPAVLIPYPHAAADHQRQNAQWAVAAGGCTCVSQQGPAECLADALAQTVAPLVADDARRRQMGLAMRSLARCDAADNVVAVIRRAAASSQRSARRKLRQRMPILPLADR